MTKTLYFFDKDEYTDYLMKGDGFRPKKVLAQFSGKSVSECWQQTREAISADRPKGYEDPDRFSSSFNDDSKETVE